MLALPAGRFVQFQEKSARKAEQRQSEGQIGTPSLLCGGRVPMAKKSIITLGAFGVICLGTAPVTAQDAAETATILSGQGATAKGQRSLGGAVSNSLDNAATAVRPVRSQARRRVTYRRAARRGRGGSNDGGIVLTTNDPLANTDAATYQTGNGTTIRVSGRLNPSASTACVNNCASEKPED